MKSPFERYVALRYVRDRDARREGRGFVRFITLVGIGGVAVGVAALILALSIVHGFSREIKDKIIGFGAHVQVESQTDQPLDDAEKLRESLRGIPGVKSAGFVVHEFVLLRRSASDIDGVVLNGVEAVPHYVSEHIIDGTTELRNADHTSGVVIGKSLAETQGISSGDHVTLFSFRGGSGSATFPGRPRVKQLKVSGIYETSLADFDATQIFADIKDARRLLNYRDDQVSRIDLFLAQPDDARAVATRIDQVHDFPVMARPIEEVYRSLFAWVKLQESIIPVVIGFIVLVALFNIGGILLMIVLEKTRSLGILASMGASRQSIRRLVLNLGLTIGILGVILGEVLALVLAAAQQQFAIIKLPPEAYYMKTAPVQMSVLDFVVVGVVTILLCLLFAYIPARVAERLDPIRVIRFS